VIDYFNPRRFFANSIEKKFLYVLNTLLKCDTISKAGELEPDPRHEMI
jgi:hypothetical protein